MAFIETIPPERAEPSVADMYQRQQSSWGYVPNYAKVFCHRPEVMTRWAALLAEIRRPMDPRRFELVTFAAAHELRNSPCTLAHFMKLREFFRDDEILALARRRSAGSVAAAELTIAAFARLVARDASQVTQAQVDRLKAQGLTDAEVFDVASAAAGRAFFSKILDALGVELDAPFLALDEALRRELTFGRVAPSDRQATRAASLLRSDAPAATT